MIPIPSDLPLLVGRHDEVVALITSRGNPDEATLFDNLCELTKYVKVKVWFDCPLNIHMSKYKYSVGATEAVIGRFFKGTTGWGYSPRHERVRSGYHCIWASHIIRYEPIVEKHSRKEGFSSLEAFARKFDLRFISPEMIKNLYDGTSAQHGGKYAQADFRQLGPRGTEVFTRFMRGFKGLDVEGPYYHEGINKLKHYSEHYSSYSATGRDITISHTLGQDLIHYSSEFSGTANGRYGLLATENTFLHLEDD